MNSLETNKMTQPPRACALAIAIGIAAVAFAQSQYPTHVLWSDPGDIASRALFYGPGGPDAAIDLHTKLIAANSSRAPKGEAIASDLRGRLWSYLDYVDKDYY